MQVLDKMGIPQLRALFLKTFNHPTGSNNAEWLRKKLAQPQDPQVGAARAAVPRARDVGAEIWTTGTTFKGFTKQERVKLQQMGGNCAAKVVEVIRDQPTAQQERPQPPPPQQQQQPQIAPASRRRRKKAATPESTKMTVIGAETFELPPPKRARSTDDGGTSQSMLYECRAPASQAQSQEPGEPLDSCFADGDAMSMPVASSMPAAMVQMQPWRTLRMADAHLLRTGCNVQVYRADERWHSGVLEKVCYSLPLAFSSPGWKHSSDYQVFCVTVGVCAFQTECALLRYISLHGRAYIPGLVGAVLYFSKIQLSFLYSGSLDGL